MFAGSQTNRLFVGGSTASAPVRLSEPIRLLVPVGTRPTHPSGPPVLFVHFHWRRKRLFAITSSIHERERHRRQYPPLPPEDWAHARADGAEGRADQGRALKDRDWPDF